MNFTYFNTKEPSIYWPYNRVGCTLIQNIHEDCDYLERISQNRCFELLKDNPDLPIYFPYRNPEVRFRSGLAVNFYRNLDPAGQKMPIFEAVFKYKEKYETELESMKTFMQWIPLHHDCLLRPYHLFDIHLDHYLWQALIMLSYGYNFKLVPLNEWSVHLINKFPKHLELIKRTERTGSFDKMRKDVLPIWEIYKKVFVDIPDIKCCRGERTINFKNWMAPEMELFRTFDKYRNLPNLQFHAYKALRKIGEKGTYFSDPHSMTLTLSTTLLKFVHEQKQEIHYFNRLYNTSKMLGVHVEQIVQQPFPNVRW